MRTKIPMSTVISNQEATLAKQTQRIDDLQAKDSTVRERFTKVLGSTRLGSESYSYSGTAQRTLSWEEIFFQVGLISARMFNNEIRNDMNDFQRRISQLESKPGKLAEISPEIQEAIRKHNE